jgi:hypothetical protein
MIRLTPDATSRTASRPGSQRLDTAEVAGNSRTSLRRDALRPGTGRGSMPDARPSGASDSRARVVPQSSISARPQRISRRFREATDVDSIRGRSESVGISGAGESRVHSRPIPTGLRPPAQGCAARATLGTTDGMKLNPNGVEPCSPVMGHNPVGVSDIGPRVARGAQPWALGRNPVGIQEQRRPSGAAEARASVLDCGGAPPLFRPRRPCESARALAQSKTSRRRLKPRSKRVIAEHCAARRILHKAFACYA